MPRKPAGAHAASETVYYWPEGFVSFSRDMVIDSSAKPYRRLSVSLLLSLDQPFTLDAGEGPVLRSSAVLIAPMTPRRILDAHGARLVICDFSPAMPEYAMLRGLVPALGVRAFGDDTLASLRERLALGLDGGLTPDELRLLMTEVVTHLAGDCPQVRTLHPRLARALELIEETPLDELSLDRLASQVHLSASRLRHLFVEQIGANYTQYARARSMLRAAWLWRPGMPLVEVAAGAGLHDTSHLNRILRGATSNSPSDYYDTSRFKLIRCAWPSLMSLSAV